MTTTTQQHRAVLVHPTAWDTLTTWADGRGLLLTAVPAAPGQLTRYTLTSPDRPSTTHQRARAGLTEREQQVLDHIARGLTNKNIGQELHLAEDTVKTHCRRIFRKLRVHDRAHAVAVGYQRGLLHASAVAITQL